jgi:hypothetical protein
METQLLTILMLDPKHPLMEESASLAEDAEVVINYPKRMTNKPVL